MQWVKNLKKTHKIHLFTICHWAFLSALTVFKLTRGGFKICSRKTMRNQPFWLCGSLRGSSKPKSPGRASHLLPGHSPSSLQISGPTENAGGLLEKRGSLNNQPHIHLMERAPCRGKGLGYHPKGTTISLRTKATHLTHLCQTCWKALHT